jgi:hypothetical protein
VSQKVIEHKGLAETCEAAGPLARSLPFSAAETPSTSPAAEPFDPDLARVVEAWPKLPEAIRRAMLAMVKSAAPAGRL